MFIMYFGCMFIFSSHNFFISEKFNQLYIVWACSSFIQYCFIVSIKVISVDYNLAKDESVIISNKLKENLHDSIVLGPSIGSTFKIKNTYRFGITIKYKKDNNLYPYLKRLLEYYQNNSKLRLDIDFNPIMWYNMWPNEGCIKWMKKYKGIDIL